MDVVDDRLVIRPYRGSPFAVHGTIEGRQVSAETVDTSLVVSERLLQRALAFVEANATFVLPDYDLEYPACVDGDGPEVALTMMRSLDRVTSIRFQPLA